MKKFIHINARSIDEAVSFLSRFGNRASVIAGGTDLLGKMKDEILPVYPEALINIKTIPNLDFIREEKGVLRIGSMTRLEDIAHEPVIKEKYAALAEAAGRTASPHIREMGRIGGNICQDIRCWYYRNPNNRFPCLRKGGGRCYAIEGDNRYHSIFGGSVEKGCYAVHPSDIAPALIALDGKVKTSKRDIRAEDFFKVGIKKTTVLDPDEIVKEIEIKRPVEGAKSCFLKFAIRKSIDFPIVNCAAAISTEKGKVKTARICLNAVYVKPYRAGKAEDAMVGKIINEENAEKAADLTVADAKPMKDNRYMVQIARIYIKRAILGCK
ncbi:MAG: FAD binding domain-containing protein [Deltaproteobacteria bacterium]|nr:FAD binding domain-containing protein [Deltaproteobacteria bacterium]